MFLLDHHHFNRILNIIIDDIKNRPSEFADGGGDFSSNLVPCAICGRKFAPDRIAKHQGICRKIKSHEKKHKVRAVEKPVYDPKASIAKESIYI